MNFFWICDKTNLLDQSKNNFGLRYFSVISKTDKQYVLAASKKKFGTSKKYKTIYIYIFFGPRHKTFLLDPLKK